MKRTRGYRATAEAVAAPTKKDREAKLHYLHDSTILPKSHFRSLNRGPCGTIPILTFSLRQHLGLDIPYLFRTCRNSVYFGTYELFKFAKSGLKIFLSSSFQRFFGQIFDQLLVILGPSNLTRSFFVMFLWGVFGKTEIFSSFKL